MAEPFVEDFADLLKDIPDDARTGHVLSPFRGTGPVTRRVDTASNSIVAIGEAAGVKVDDRDGKTKFAPKTCGEPSELTGPKSFHLAS